jgi:hypothetical protein
VDSAAGVAPSTYLIPIRKCSVGRYPAGLMTNDDFELLNDSGGNPPDEVEK